MHAMNEHEQQTVEHETVKDNLAPSGEIHTQLTCTKEKQNKQAMNSSVQVPVGQVWLIESQVESGKVVGSVLSRDVASLTVSLEVSKETGFCRSPKRAAPQERRTCLRHPWETCLTACLKPVKFRQDRHAR